MEVHWLKLVIPQGHQESVFWEELGYQLFNLGASGTELVDQNFTAYFQADNLSRIEIEKILAEHLITDFTISTVKNENWVGMCEELFQPVQINNLGIVPVFDYQLRPKVAGQIYIIPGMGFGSGHHETSQMLSKILQTLPITREEMLDVLDFGTGSGILSLVTTEIFPNAKILAVDNDPQALLNAEDNLKINQSTKNITLTSQDLKVMTRAYDLILANIYLEVLKSYQVDLKRLLKADGYLLISGITVDQDEEFREAFNDWNYQLVETSGNWKSYLLKK